MSQCSMQKAEALVVSDARVYARRYAEASDTLPPLDSYLDEFLAEVSGARRVLDLGCGTGRALEYFRMNGVPGAIGVDISGDMIREGRMRYPQVDMRVMPMSALTFPESSFDGVFACCSLQFMPKVEAAAVLKRVYRLLSLGGACYLIFPLHFNSWEGMVKEEGRTIYHAEWVPAEIDEALENAGLTVMMSDINFKGGATIVLGKKEV